MINEEELKQEELKLRQKQLELDRLKLEKLEAEELKEKQDLIEKEEKEKAQIERNKEIAKQSRKEVNMWIGIIIVAIIIFIIYIASQFNYSDDTTDEHVDYRSYSQVYTEDYIESLLKSPSTAEFGTAEITETSFGNYHIKNYVDSENSFGAMIRMNYECDITWSGNNYEIENVTTE